ncbi:MAG: hypothetical protein ABSA92_06505 [Candidatus Bathyarchaeia archaeon]|jgi:hypothetical protein
MTVPDSQKKNLKLTPDVEFDKMLSRLLTDSSETIKEVERVIKSPDSETKLTYEVQVDSHTGKQKVIEKFTTTKRECGVCGGYFAQLLSCADCGISVCAGDCRQKSWGEWEDRQGRRFPAENIGLIPDTTGLKFVSRKATLCRSCFESA